MSNQVAKQIWDFLEGWLKNEYGAAAIMGNLMAESSLHSDCATGKNKTENYVADADSGAVDFVHDRVAFGLVQWCYYSRKEGLYNFAKEKGVSVGDLYLQLEYIKEELPKYKTVYKAVTEATEIKAPTEIVMLKYEKPGTTTDEAKAKRIKYATGFYEAFADGGDEGLTIPKVVCFNGSLISEAMVKRMYIDGGFRERFAMEHGIAIIKDGLCTFDTHWDAQYDYTDWIGACYDLNFKKWVN